jgi:hypothetical protein
MELRGMVDATAEIVKLEKQLGSVDQRVQGLERQMTIPGYETKVAFSLFFFSQNSSFVAGSRGGENLAFIPPHPPFLLPSLPVGPCQYPGEQHEQGRGLGDGEGKHFERH